MAEDLKFAATMDSAAFAAGMAKVEAIGKAAAERVSSSFGTALGSLTGPIAAIGSAVAAAFATKNIIDGVTNVFAAGRALAQLSRETGTSVQGLVVLQSKFKQAGVDGDAVGGAILKLQRVMAGLDEKSEKGAAAIERIGLSMDDLRKLSPDQQMMQIGKALADVPTPAERAANAIAIFGEEGGKLLNVFRQGDFGTVGAGLQKKAEMMARNAAIFEQVSIKLEKVGGVLKTFYAGVADRVVTTLAPILDRLEKINLVGIGQKFGDGIAYGAQMFLGAFSHPELFASTLENGLAAGVLGMGNVLVATLKSGGEFFKDGLLDSLQGIGSAIVATLMEAFDKPIRYLQAGVEAAMQTAQYLMDKASGKKDDDSGLGGMTDQQRTEHWQKWQKVRDGRFDQIAKSNGINIGDNDDGSGVKRTAALAGKDASYNNANAEYLKARQYDPSKYARTPQSMEEIMAGHANDPTRFGLYGGGQTAAEWRQRAKEQGSAGWEKGMAAVRGFHVDDVFGAGDYASKATAGGNRLAALGRRMLGPTSATAGVGTAAGPSGGDPVTEGNLAQIRMAAAQSGVSTKGMDRKTLIGMASSLMYLGPNGPNGGMDAAGNANDPYTQRVDAQRKRGQFLAHTVGGGTALDFDPSQREGWTGAKSVGRVGGLGAAYGRTGNIMTQVSGRVGGNKDPMEAVAGHTSKLVSNSDKMLSYLTGGGGSSGGGGASVTR